MKDAKSVLLVLLSIGMIGTWVYHFYDKSHYATLHNNPIEKDTAAMVEAIRDSLQQAYASTLREIKDPPADSSGVSMDSLKTQLGTRLSEINKLRNEINVILSNKKISREELFDAKNKIIDLRSRIEDMQDKNSTLEQQQKQLTGELEQLNTDMKGLETTMNKLGEENKELKEKISTASTLNATDIRFSFVDINPAGDTEMETTKAKRANKFVISFILQNSIAQFNNTEVIVVVTGPDNQVITNEVWESGNFETKNEGTQIYTRKLKFDYERNEQKRLIFSLDYADFKKGQYKMKLYHNGVQIAETTKSLG